MRLLNLVIATIFTVGMCEAHSSESMHCEGAGLTRKQLQNIVLAYLNGHGGNPESLDTSTNIQITPVGCDYFVTVSDVPGRPGGHTVYRISRAGKIVDVVGGA